MLIAEGNATHTERGNGKASFAVAWAYSPPKRDLLHFECPRCSYLCTGKANPLTLHPVWVVHPIWGWLPRVKFISLSESRKSDVWTRSYENRRAFIGASDARIMGNDMLPLTKLNTRDEG